MASWVYFASRFDGAIKIGFSANPVVRVRELGATLLAITPGGRAKEKALHTRFAAYRITGEWFRAGRSLLALVKKVSARRIPKALYRPQNVVHLRIDGATRRRIERWRQHSAPKNVSLSFVEVARAAILNGLDILEKRPDR